MQVRVIKKYKGNAKKCFRPKCEKKFNNEGQMILSGIIEKPEGEKRVVEFCGIQCCTVYQVESGVKISSLEPMIFGNI